MSLLDETYFLPSAMSYFCKLSSTLPFSNIGVLSWSLHTNYNRISLLWNWRKDYPQLGSKAYFISWSNCLKLHFTGFYTQVLLISYLILFCLHFFKISWVWISIYLNTHLIIFKANGEIYKHNWLVQIKEIISSNDFSMHTSFRDFLDWQICHLIKNNREKKTNSI